MKQPRVTAKEVEKVAKKFNFFFKRHGRGSHEIWQQLETGRILVISKHSGETIKPGTMNEILKSLNISSEEFQKLA